MRNLTWPLLTCLYLLSACNNRIPIQIKGMVGNDPTPVNISLKKLPPKVQGMALWAISETDETQIPFQIVGDSVLYFMSQKDAAHYELRASSGPNVFAALDSEKKDGLLSIQYIDQALLGYHFGTMMPPDSVDPAFQRSGFIHPVYSPKGNLLTRVQPPDHYHHYGIWNPWTHTEYRGDTIDFWNLKKRQGTVRFADFLDQTAGAIFYEFTALHEHVVFGESQQEVVPLREKQQVIVYQPQDTNYYLVDINLEYQIQGNDPLHLLQYRYGGFAWRPTSAWNHTNSEVLTSAGKTRTDADGSLGKWCFGQGELGNNYGGILILSHPDNFNHPEPLRIWPVDMHSDFTELFINFATTKNTDWLLEPGKTYHHRYRLVVYQDKMEAERAEQFWQNYAEPPRVEVQ